LAEAPEHHRSDAGAERPGGPSPLRSSARIVGPLLALALLLFTDLDPGNPAVTSTAAVAFLMAAWWITEAIPLAATALLPMALFPLLGIMDGKQVAPLYFNHIVFLFIGGFIVALAMQRWGLHQRIALRILLLSGTHSRRILLGFMLASGFLSMWISNSAATMMMVPIALAITRKMCELLPGEASQRLTVGVLLGVAYGSSIGGLATLVGTPPNLSFTRIFAITFEDAPEITFADWFLFAFPTSALFLLVAWAYLARRFCRKSDQHVDRSLFHQQYRALGPMSFAEKVVLVDFIALVCLWLTRVDIRLGFLTLPGWSGLFSHPDYLNDGSVAIAVALVLFLLPARPGSAGRVMSWKTASGIPWDLILLFGGGFALASGFKHSGLSVWIGGQLAGVSALPPLLVVVAVCLLLTFLTELTSNTATAEMLLPIIAALAVTLELNPLLLMVPATLACSCAFMLPVATPPNAIVFGSHKIRIADMARAGLTLNLIGVVIITAAVFLLGSAVLGIDVDVMPEWAR
jgi:sodium-dependent dicarboxylate transporter 2/3/5